MSGNSKLLEMEKFSNCIRKLKVDRTYMKNKRKVSKTTPTTTDQLQHRQFSFRFFHLQLRKMQAFGIGEFFVCVCVYFSFIAIVFMQLQSLQPRSYPRAVNHSQCTANSALLLESFSVCFGKTPEILHCSNNKVVRRKLARQKLYAAYNIHMLVQSNQKTYKQLIVFIVK